MDNLPEQPVLPSSMPPSESGWGRKRRVIFIIAVVLVVFSVGLIIFLAQGRPAPIPKSGSVEEEVPHPTVDPIPEDSDRDGLTNEEEAVAGTSGTEFDTDRDGLSDIDEIRIWKTDPKNVDSDGDGFGDGIEVIRGFNPAGPGKLQI